jgi:predicted HAD superfamily Cof-like phosphohydrolase
MPRKVAELRKKLMAEEVWETIQAIDEEDLVLTADGLCDVLYVVYGTAEAAGLDLEPLFDEVQRSNLSKLPFETREDGKILKGENYSPPNLKPLIEAQIKDTI